MIPSGLRLAGIQQRFLKVMSLYSSGILRMIFDEILNEYEAVVGHVIIGADKAYRWLRWLGAEFGPPQGMVVPI